MVYVDTIVEGRSPTRKVVPLSKLNAEMRKWIGITNTYRSIYTFSNLDVKGRPDWDSANLDVIYLDVDIMNSEGKIHDEDLMPKIIKWLNDTNYRRTYLFTGGGFGVSIDVSDAKKERIYTAHYYLRGELDFNLDKAAIDLARGRRMVPSYNFNKGAYVSYVSEQEAGLPFRELFSRYQKATAIKINPIVYGKNPWSLKEVKSKGKQFSQLDPGPIAEARKDIGIKEIEERYGEICDTVLKLARQDHVTHQERFFLILYLKDVLGVPYTEFADAYHALIGDGRDFAHSIGEQQGRYAYGSGNKFNPRIFKMYGYCPHDCEKCTEEIEEKRKLLDGIML